PLAIAVDCDPNLVSHHAAHSFQTANVVVRVVMADLDLDSGKTVRFDSMADLREHRVEIEVHPADIGVVGFETVRARAPEVLPEWNAGPLGGNIPERDVDGGERKM